MSQQEIKHLEAILGVGAMLEECYINHESTINRLTIGCAVEFQLASSDTITRLANHSQLFVLFLGMRVNHSHF